MKQEELMKARAVRRAEFTVTVDDMPPIRCEVEVLAGAHEGAHVARTLHQVGDMVTCSAVGLQSIARLISRLSRHAAWGVEVESAGGRETRRATAGDDGWAWAVGVQTRILADGLGVRS